MSEAFESEVVIIGAGPAGSSAAIMLARAGRRVTVIETKRFPRDKVCGGCLSGTATEKLRDLLGKGVALPGVPTERIAFVIGSCRVTCAARGRTRLVTRLELDARLVQAAADAGATIRCGEAASLERGPFGWQVLAAGERWPARHVFVACGINRLAESIGIRGRSSGRVLVSQRWVQPTVEPLPRLGDVELHWLRGGYVGLAIPRLDHCTVATAVEADDLQGESAFEHLRRLNPDAGVLDALQPNGDGGNARGTAGFPWLPSALGRDNVLLVGDAAGYEEPYTGDGMGQAMISAECAVRAILAGGDVLRHYAALMRRHHRPGLMRARWLSRLLRSRVVRCVASMGAARHFGKHLGTVIERVHVNGPARATGSRFIVRMYTEAR